MAFNTDHLVRDSTRFNAGLQNPDQSGGRQGQYGTGTQLRQEDSGATGSITWNRR